MTSRRLLLFTLFCTVGLSFAAAEGESFKHPFAIEVIDEATGRGVPLIRLETVNSVRYYTDSGGIAAIDDPDLAGRDVFFSVSGDGYDFPADGFGIKGKRFRIEPGTVATIKVQRKNIAERLYRITGGGIYRDTVEIGRRPPIRQPLLNANVFGQDSVQNAVYQGRLFWLWGDTMRPSYPLGNYAMSGATSALPGKGGLDPDHGVDLDYFTGEDGFARGMAPIPGEGPTWLGGLVAVPETGRVRLFAAYSKIRGHLETYEQGLCRYDDATGRFEKVTSFPLDAPVVPYGHAVRRTEGGTEYVYFGDPFPLVRVRATGEALRDLSQYEAFTPLQDGSRLAEARIDRDAAGKVRYAWRKNTPAVSPEQQERLMRKGLLRREEALLSLIDPGSGKPVVIHRGSVCWNDYRKRWIMIATEIGGTSQLGEIWYAEAERPEGPWGRPRRIVTHRQYSFYNPCEHPELDQKGGRIIYFEGTYTAEFSGNPERTPRYDYNQMMYRLDLDDPRLR